MCPRDYVPKNPQGKRKSRAKLTAVKVAKFVTCLLRIVHALQEGRYTGIVLSPEVVGDYDMVLALIESNHLTQSAAH